MTQITKNSTLEEFYTGSTTARKLGIYNTPTEEAKKNLIALAKNVLQPLRDAYGKSIVLNSGYRCPKLNNAVGGVSNSQHTLGMAADIRCNDKTTREWIFNYIKNNLPFDQLILEHNKSGVYWVHVSYSTTKNRKQVIGNLLKK